MDAHLCFSLLHAGKRRRCERERCAGFGGHDGQVYFLKGHDNYCRKGEMVCQTAAKSLFIVEQKNGNIHGVEASRFLRFYHIDIQSNG